nr:ATP synthase subunit 6 [Monopterus albus]
MMVNVFSQFEIPVYMGVPVILIALTLPLTLLPTPSHRWVDSRSHALQHWCVGQLTKQLMGSSSPKAQLWATLLISLMLYLLTMNLSGMIPHTYTPTTQLSMNMGLAIPLWLATVLVGFRNQPTPSLAHLLPEGTPTPLIPLLIIIETLSLLMRPFALGVRLTANLTAGHLLIQLIATATLTIMPLMPVYSVFTALLLLFLTMLELAVAVIQAYVFVLLLSLYLQENT